MSFRAALTAEVWTIMSGQERTLLQHPAYAADLSFYYDSNGESICRILL
jgi:hypothetical protein